MMIDSTTSVTYPQTVIEILDDRIRFPQSVINAMRCFADWGPWSGNRKDRRNKIRHLNRRLAAALGVLAPELRFVSGRRACGRGSCYVVRLHQIILVGKISVVTYLHEFAHSLGLDEMGACRWSINLFRLCFPEKYSRLSHEGHILVRSHPVSGFLANPSADRKQTGG